MFRVLFCSWLCLWIAGFFAPQASAAGAMHLRSSSGAEVVISSQKLIGDNNKQTVELIGDVKVVYDQQFISCDHAIIDRKAETVLVEGNLVISSPQAYIEGDSALLSYRDNTGTIQNGFVKSGPVIFEGRVVKKTGPLSYDAEKASFTACTTCPTAWTFSGSRIQAEIGGYAYIKSAEIRLANIPALWLPYLIVPLKSQRSTGFLVPTIEFRNASGTGFGESFFWAIDRSQDATFGLKYYTYSGVKGLVNYRYSLNPTSKGELSFGMIHDNVFSGAQEVSGQGIQVGPKVNRQFLTSLHNYDLPDGFNTKLKLNYVTDLLYPRDFPEEILGAGDPALENRFTLSRNTERVHASLDTSYYINQLHSNPIDTNRETVHRLPEIRYDLIERPLSSDGFFRDVLFDLHFDYANFTRDDLAWDDAYTDPAGVRHMDRTRSNLGQLLATPGVSIGPNGGGNGSVFDPGVDVVRTGQRIDFEPQLSLPFRVGSWLDALPTVSFRDTQYALNVTPPPGSDYDTAPYRQYIRGTLSLRTRFARVFGDNTPPPENAPLPVTAWADNESKPMASGSTTLVPVAKPPSRPNVYRHEIEPEIIVDGVHDTHHVNSPFLGAAQRTPPFLDAQPISDTDVTSQGLQNNGGQGIQFDYEDRFTQRNTIGAYLSNRIVQKSWGPDGAPVYKQIASLKLGESYDFDELEIGNRQQFEWSDLSALLDVRTDHFETNTLIRYFPYHGKTNTGSRVRLIDSGGRFVEANYFENYLITLNRDDALQNHTQTVGLATGFVQKYVEFLGSIDFTPVDWNHFQFAVRSWAASAKIKPPGNCWGIIYTLRQDLGRELSQHLNFDYNFGGEAPRIAAAK